MFSNFKLIFQSFTLKERFVFLASFSVLIISFIARTSFAIAENSKLVPVAGGIYTEGIVGQPVSLNPIISYNQTDQDISALLYARLSDLLESYDIGKDDRSYNLKIKEDLLWSDNHPLTSDDIIFTIKTIQDINIASPFKTGWDGIIAERLSELQVRLNLPTPYSFLVKNISRLPIIPKHIFGNIPINNLKLSAYNFEPVVNGPYQVKEFLKRKDGFIAEYRLIPNKNYVGSSPFIKNFYFRFFENEKKLLESFASREINGFGSLFNLRSLSENNKTIIEKIPMSRYYALFYNQQINSLLKEKNLRYALNYAIPKDKIIVEIFQGQASLTESPLFNQDKNFGFGYNLEKAKSYFEKIDAKKRENIELNIVVPEIDLLKNTAEIIKKSWLELGIAKVNILPLNAKDITDNIFKARNYEIVLFGNILENKEDVFPFWHSSQKFYPGLNFALYQNSKADTLMENIRQNLSGEESTENLNLLQKTIAEDAPAAFLFTLPYFYAHSKNLGGFAFNSSSSDFISNPNERFKNINQWYTVKARVLK